MVILSTDMPIRSYVPDPHNWGRVDNNSKSTSTSTSSVHHIFNTGATWSSRKNGYYIKEQHGKTNECYDFNTAKSKCETASNWP